MKLWHFAAMAGLLFACAAARAQTPDLPPGFDPQKHMRVDEVKLGMKGYGLSVFKGAKIERFDVEVLSIMRNFTPQHNVILINCKGANLEHTGSIAGMSGSPIYLRDEQGRERLAGAFAYGWPLMKDPMAGVQPIEYMLQIKESKSNQTASRATPTTQSADARASWPITDAIMLPGMKKAPAVFPFASLGSMQPNARLGGGDDDAKRLRPLQTPLMTSGLPANVIEQFSPVLSAYGLVPLQAGAAGSAPQGQMPEAIEPGGTMAVPLLTGDMEFTAIGTCTAIVGDRVLGFGHPFQNEGNIAVPMGTGYIHSVIANLNTSFKLGALGKVTGGLVADQSVGICGRVGAPPPTVPLKVRVVYADGSIDKTYNYQAALHPRFTPLLSAIAANGAITGTHDLPQYHTLDYDVNMEFANGQSVSIQNTDVNAGPQEIFFSIATPQLAALNNPFERVPVKKIDITIKVTKEAREAAVLSVNIPKAKFEPGDTVKGFVTYRPFRGTEATLPIEFALPHDLPDGVYQLGISDWQTYLAEEQQVRPFAFSSQSIDDVFAVMRQVTGVRHNALYLRLNRKPDGVAIGRTAMPRLPGSRRQVLMGAGLSNVTPFVSSTVKVMPTDYVMSGSAQFTIIIDKGDKLDGKAIPPRREVRPVPPTARPAAPPAVIEAN